VHAICDKIDLGALSFVASFPEADWEEADVACKPFTDEVPGVSSKAISNLTLMSRRQRRGSEFDRKPLELHFVATPLQVGPLQ
jgi:hypothetical protein